MVNKILVPLDGSGLAERALTYATALAAASGAQLILLRAARAHTLPGVDPREREAGAIRIDDALHWMAVRDHRFATKRLPADSRGHPLEIGLSFLRLARVTLI